MASVIVLSGQVNSTTALTSVQFTTASPGTYEIKPLKGNIASVVYVGNDGSTTGSVSTANGFQLEKSVDALLITVTNLNQLWLCATSGGNTDGVSWIKVMNQVLGHTPPVA